MSFKIPYMIRARGGKTVSTGTINLNYYSDKSDNITLWGSNTPCCTLDVFKNTWHIENIINYFNLFWGSVSRHHYDISTELPLQKTNFEHRVLYKCWNHACFSCSNKSWYVGYLGYLEISTNIVETRLQAAYMTFCMLCTKFIISAAWLKR